MFFTHIILFLTLRDQVSAINVKNELGSPTLMDLAEFAVTRSNPARIVMTMVSPCNFIVVCVLNYLLGSFVIIHVRVAFMLIGMIVRTRRTWVQTVCMLVVHVLAAHTFAVSVLDC